MASNLVKTKVKAELNRPSERAPFGASGAVAASPSDDKSGGGRVKKLSHSVEEWALALRYDSQRPSVTE